MQKRQQGSSGAPVRIIGGTFGQFVRDGYEWWQNGCLGCVICTVIDSYEKGESSHEQFEWRMKLLYDSALNGALVFNGGDHPAEFPRRQLEMFVNQRERR